MEKCCAVPHEGHPPLCPLTAMPVKPVGRITVESLVQPKIRAELRQQPYYFCDGPECDVVYVSALGDHLITKDMLTVRVGMKEMVDPIPLCYCFGFDQKAVRDDIRERWSTEIQRVITAKVKAGECRCEVTNPSGTCCLGNVSRAIKEAQALHEQGRL